MSPSASVSVPVRTYVQGKGEHEYDWGKAHGLSIQVPLGHMSVEVGGHQARGKLKVSLYQGRIWKTSPSLTK